jgi:hypothetical protein
MKKENLNTEKLNVLENFVNEVSKELNVNFNYSVEEFSRGYVRGSTYKKEEFVSPFFKSKSIGYEISFIPYSKDSVELWSINVKNRGNGIGSEIMSRILDVSDKTGIKVKLIPVDYDRDKNTPINYLQKLKKWYSVDFRFRKSAIIFDPYFTYSPSSVEYKMIA